jgi:hypothetical protein
MVHAMKPSADLAGGGDEDHGEFQAVESESTICLLIGRE